MMVRVDNMADLRAAIAAREAEVVVTDEKLAGQIRLWNSLRMAANVAVIVVLGAGIFAWANPLRLFVLEQGWALLARRVMLGVGVLLLFAEYVLPVVRLYRPAGADAEGLKLVPRRAR